MRQESKGFLEWSPKAKEVSGAFLPIVLFGIIGGILITAGIFLPMEEWLKMSGWDFIREYPSGSIGYLLLLIGGVLVLLGGTTLAFKIKSAVYLVLVGGILAIFGMNINVYSWSDMGYGYYMCLVGSIVSVVSGIVGLKKLPSLTVTKEVKATEWGTGRVKSKEIEEHTGSGIASLILGIFGIIIGVVPMQYTPETLLGGGILMLLFGLMAAGLGASVREKDSFGKAGMILGIIVIVLSILVMAGAAVLMEEM